MAIKRDDIAAMRARIQADADRLRSELRKAQEELAALDVLERAVRAEEGEVESLPLPGLDVDATPGRSAVPFAQAVREAVQTLRGIEFTVFDVEDALRKQRRPLPLKNARTRITLELIAMASKRSLVRTFAGSGTMPNRYRLATIHQADGDE